MPAGGAGWVLKLRSSWLLGDELPVNLDSDIWSGSRMSEVLQAALARRLRAKECFVTYIEEGILPPEP